MQCDATISSSKVLLIYLILHSQLHLGTAELHPANKQKAISKVKNSITEAGYVVMPCHKVTRALLEKKRA